MPKRRTLHTSLSSKRTRVTAATNNLISAREASSQTASERQSPRKALAAASKANAASQATATASPSVTTFESQLLELQVEDEIVAPTEGSRAGTVATTEAGDGDNSQDEIISAPVDSFASIN
ncbi:hypothetical protein EK21DRAFT_81522 [Setomelanomma holmii]|uniref:Uncharacterized protein n=1 Tax=Setomelanomma holmii TaxID=210430 RepID=A0A9P4LFH6_9PLEO|nr:hypothetical protein EK21DRAFT_81522 [Setomelanomma holmii]